MNNKGVLADQALVFVCACSAMSYSAVTAALAPRCRPLLASQACAGDGEITTVYIKSSPLGCN